MYIAAKGKGVVVGRCFAAVPLIGQGHDWQLPYSAVVLPPNEMPSAYFNKKGLMERQNSKGRFIIQLPLLPYAAGPVQYDQMGNPIFQQLPNGHVIYSYYDELEYHAQLQQQQQQQPLPLHPSAGGSTAAGSSASERQQQQQQQQHQPLPQSNAVGSSSSSFQMQQPSQQQHQRTTDANPAAHQQQHKRQQKLQHESSAAATAGDALTKAPGGGRGRGRGRGAGTKRSRDAPDHAVGTGNAAAAAPAAPAVDAGSGGGAALAEEQPAAKKATVARSGSRVMGAHRPPVPDPLGYKQQKQSDVPVLAPELVEALLKMAPAYLGE
jgi:hypothetical protein